MADDTSAFGGAVGGKIEAWANQRRATIRGVEFTFRTLPAMDAHDVLEDLRVSVEGRLIVSALSGMEAGNISMVQVGIVLATLPRIISKADLAAIRLKMFEAVDFRKVDTKDTPGPLIMPGGVSDEARCFAVAGPIAIYEVLLRSLAVNFFEYLGEGLSALDSVLQDSASTAPQT